MKEKIAIISILVNLILASGKIFAGVISHSTAVLADGVHSFMDVFSSAIGYIGIKISQNPEDKKHPYGHYKFEALAGFFITLILFASGAVIIFDAYKRFLNPSLIEIPILAYVVMIFSALVNEIMARLKIHFGKKENSIALLSDGFHSRIDVFTSLLVFSGLFLTKYWVHTDSLLALLIGLYIIKESFSLGKEAIDSMLDVSAGSEVEKKIKAIAKNQNIIIEDLKTQKKGSVVTVNLLINLPSKLNVSQATKISEGLRQKLMQQIKNLAYVSIQIKSHEVETGFYKRGFSQGFGWQKQGGLGGYCICPNCSYKISHQRGIPCSTLKCPSCKINLERK